MSEHSLKRQLKVLTVPVFIEMALVMMLGAVDTVMLSRYSDNSVAAVGLDNQLMSLVFLVYQFFSMGAAIICAQYIGAGFQKRLVQVVGMALVVNLLLGLTVSALLFVFAEQLLHLMGVRPELMGDALVYLRLTGALSFFQALSLTFSASLRSAGKVTYPMVVTGIVNVVNIIGNMPSSSAAWAVRKWGSRELPSPLLPVVLWLPCFWPSYISASISLVSRSAISSPSPGSNFATYCL